MKTTTVHFRTETSGFSRGGLKSTIVFIVGPTAAGKTRLSIKLAKRLKGEIISADSMQVYKGMNITSQAATGRKQLGVRHHLVGVLDPSKEYNVSIFKERAEGIISSILKRAKVPIIVGGSGLYVKALIDGLFPSPASDMAFRLRMAKFAEKHGSPKLHKKLAKIDPDSAGSIHPNDARRIIRALELYNSTGNTMTELKLRTKGLGDRFRIKMFGLNMSREKIYEAINIRAEQMFKEGLVGEIKRLSEKKLSKTARMALGYKEVFGFINGEYGLDESKEMLKMNTRRFAKRQLAWFRAWGKRVKWFDPEKIADARIIEAIKRKVF